MIVFSDSNVFFIMRKLKGKLHQNALVLALNAKVPEAILKLYFNKGRQFLQMYS